MIVEADATSMLCPYRTRPCSYAFPPRVSNVASAFQNKSIFPKRDFSFTTKFHKSKTQNFLISTNTDSIICKTSPTNTPEHATAHNLSGAAGSGPVQVSPVKPTVCLLGLHFD
jgi:hypothetical protein